MSAYSYALRGTRYVIHRDTFLGSRCFSGSGWTLSNLAVFSSRSPYNRYSLRWHSGRTQKIPLQSIGRCTGLNGKFFSDEIAWTILTSTSSGFSSISKQNVGGKIGKVSQSIPQKFVDNCPLSIQPYLRLSRIQNPIGTWLLFLPCTWGLVLGTGGLPDLYLLGLFGTGAFIMRGAGCTINDMWDKHIDAKVKRTANRPLASGELRMRHAAAWLLLQLSVAFSILLQLNAPCFIIGLGSLGLVGVYPLAKRVTNWPQVVLGLTFNTGILMGFTAVQNGQLGYLTFPMLDPSCLSLYLAGISWTLIYDTIYAHQDIEDDTTLGLGSTARVFGEDTKAWLSGFSCLMISSLTAGGVLGDLSWPYYAGIAATASHLVWQIKTLDIHNSNNCSDRFNYNRHIGWIILMGIYGSYLMESRKLVPQPNTASSMTIDSSITSTGPPVIVDINPGSQSNPIVKNYTSLRNS